MLAEVTLQAVPADHPFHALENEGNGFLVELPHALVKIFGKGAGRWPTAESVFADIMDIQRASEHCAEAANAPLAAQDDAGMGHEETVQ